MRAAAAAPSRRQLSKWDRERRQMRLLWVGAGALVALVVLILAGGWVLDHVVRPRDTVADVNGQQITAGQLLDAVRPQARAVDNQASAGTGDPSAVDQQKRALPDQMLSTLVEQTIIQQEADRRGITVSDDEVEQQLQQILAQRQASSQPTPAPTPSPADVGAAPTTPTPLPTLEPDAGSAALQTLLNQTGFTDSQVRYQVRQEVLYNKVQAAVVAEQVPTSQEQIHARHILLKTQDDANNALQQLQNGADFGQLAQQVSTDPGSKDKGGDLGWFPRGIMNKPFEDAAFALQPGQTSGVVQSPSGYHIIQVLEQDPNRPVAPDQLQTLQSQAFNTWLQSRQTGSDVHQTLSDTDRDWILVQLGVRPS
ncbi:MAG: peptidylprolyl isomerase [Chloroflexi bacterium]|nr:peptidylprolyl isomerase [Chloroflexota bacterium]